MSILTACTLLLYGLSVLVFWQRIYLDSPAALCPGSQPEQPGVSSFAGLCANQRVVFSLVALLIGLHGWLLRSHFSLDGQVNLALGNLFSLVCLMTVITFWLGAINRDTLNIGVLVMPIGLIGLFSSTFLSGTPQLVSHAPTMLWVHLCIALLAFGLLCIAAAQALLLYLQVKRLQKPTPGRLFPALPALQTMETNLFRLTLYGVVLLSVNLATGMMVLWQTAGKPLAFNHHILLSFLAWLGFSALLVGHKVYGWRGRIAAKWTLVAFAILLLAFFGSRFVTSIILQRGLT